jgi:hypothetical protein
MSAIASVLIALPVLLGITTIGGQVVGPDGTPIPNAQVFLELGLGGMVLDTVAGPDGEFEFPDVGPGPAGVFAIAPGYGFEGRHLSVAVADEVPRLRLSLHPAEEIRGQIVDSNGKSVAKARITRIGVKGAHKVGVPLAKLRQFGYAEPESDSDGNFVLKNVPRGTKIDLKVGHSRFAQEGVPDLPAGTSGAKITLYSGVLVEGEVIARATKRPAGQIAVLIRNAGPPYDTALARSSIQGKFSIRLKPGVYTYRANGAGLQSAGWERLTVTGERDIEHLRVAVAGLGQIRGSVRDALSGKAVRGVRISLTTNGTRAAIARTGPGGDFLFAAGEGENVVRVEAAPGYYPPESQDLKVRVSEGSAVELPGMWLKPLPDYTLTVVDDAGQPVPGALISLLRPAQFGWHVADASGQVTIRIQNVPDGGTILGRAEHPTKSEGALFSLDRQGQSASAVQLFPLASISGRVVNSRGRGLGGAVVGSFFPGEVEENAILLWQTRSSSDGTFQWDAVIPGVPQRCAASLQADARGESATFNLSPGMEHPLADITVAGGKASTVMLGDSFPWYTMPLQCGTLPDAASREGRPVLLFCTDAGRAPAAAETAARLNDVIANPNLIVAVLADGPISCDANGAVPILLGETPSSATTLLLDRNGRVVLESVGMPPARLLHSDE